MAVEEEKEEAVGAEKEEKMANNAIGTEKAENGEDTGEKEELGMGEGATEEKEEIIKLAYIGPTLPSGQLKCNKIFIGTEKEIKKELETVLEKYPLVGKMLVPASLIGEKKDKVKTAGNILHKYYSDLVSCIAGNMAKEG